MQKFRKRKQQLQLKQEGTETKSAKFSNGKKEEPYPTHPRPTPDECRALRDSLLSFHGFPQDFAKYRNRNLKSQTSDSKEEEETILDGLVQTVLSQNTTQLNSQKAFCNLKSAFPKWEDVLAAESKCLENAIRCGGLAPTKAHCIKNMLQSLHEKRGKLCLEYLRNLPVDEIKAELSNFKGIGPKTVACVLMFNLQKDDFPVDTHVFEIAKTIGWVPEVADRNKTYLHLNQRIPNDLKFDLNCLLYTHGKLCRNCAKRGSSQHKKETRDDTCAILNYCNNFCVKTTDGTN